MRMGISLGINRLGGGGFSPLSLFSAGEVGAWYDPSDLSTLFQDTAGTVPVTAAGQSVARINDKSGRGNHATQSTAASRPAYQTSGGLHWLAFDGSDDWLVTGTITPGTDKAQVFAGVRKLSDAATALVLETSTTINSNAGALYLAAPESTGASGNYTFASRGSAAVSPAVASGTLLAPNTSVITASSDIAADARSIRINGVTASSVTTPNLGTGNYLAYPLYIGRRGGTTLPFNGNLYSLVVRFSSANLDAGRLAATERWIATRTGVTI